MQSRTPYATPRANVARADDAVEYGEVRVLSPHGRIGRVRYIGYSMGLSIVVLLVAGFAAGVVGVASPGAAVLVGVLGYVALLAVQFLLSIQRSHDMNVTGWLSLISLIPLGVLVFWVVPGTRGENDYGKPPPPNTAGAIVLACLLPVVAVGGILAAIAIPAYQDYSIRAQVSEGLNLAAAAKAAVANAYERTGVAPPDRVAAGMSAAATDSAGQYVASIDVDRGTVVVTYGSNANPVIANGVLALQPYVASDDSLVWRCGRAAAPGGAMEIDRAATPSHAATSIEPRYLPSACRP
jgi:type IV pilus assembly protein PilA